MPEMNYMELNLMQILDVLRQARVARLAVSEDGKPYVVPVFCQLEVTRSQVVLHLASADEGRKIEALRRSALVCLELEMPGCAWLDTVLVEGRAAMGVPEEGAGVELFVHAQEMSGRRYFIDPG